MAAYFARARRETTSLPIPRVTQSKVFHSMPDLAYPLRWLWLYRRRLGWASPHLSRWLRAPPRTSIAVVYPALCAGRLADADRLLTAIFAQVSDRRTLREALVGRLLLRIAEGDGQRARRILRFIALHYSPADRNGAVAVLQPKLAGFAATSGAPPALRTLGGYAGPATWAAFEPKLASIVAELTDEPRTATERRHHATGAMRAPSRRPATVVLLSSGGLGNQLFQYAAALACARRSGVEPRIDLAIYKSPQARRSFHLSRLDLPLHIATLREAARAARFCHQEVPSLIDRVLLEHRGDITLRGYWENPRYFAEIEPDIRARFRPRDPSDAAASADFVARARQRPALVGVHVRRGDRAPNRNEIRDMPLSPNFYRRAAAALPPGASFAIFSDRPGDIDWCRANLGLEELGPVTYADGGDPIVDLFALAGCDHQIISASTFSWWAAWLNPNPAKIVIAPPLQQGYGPRSADYDLDTRLPVDWRIIPDEPPDRCDPI